MTRVTPLQSPSAADSSGARCQKIMLLVAGDRPDIAAEAERLFPHIGQLASVEHATLNGVDDLSAVEFDVAIVFGGDGSILRAAHQMGRNQRPMIGVNLGKLGFLADLSPEEFRTQLPAICSGSLPVVEHLMFDCQLYRRESLMVEQLGLNEVAVFAGPPFAIIDIDLYVDSKLVTTYSCDGLIVSTPVGSTAHNLSAGGPILRKELQAFVISPISPHTLTIRPVVDSADRRYEIVVPQPHEGTTLVADGRVLAKLEQGDLIRIERSAAQFKLLAVPGHNYYRTLREKLGWSGRIQLNDPK
jgi:NAD+ kinase